MDMEKVIAWLADEELYYRDHGDTHNSLMACNAIALLKVIKNNSVHLCNSCCKKHSDCNAENNDIILGDRCGDNNICACNKYVPFAESDSQSCSDMILIPEETYYNTIALLKEQEAVEPDSEHHLFVCPVCRSVLKRGQKFCHECGKHIKWEGRLSE